jgi:hypothetical protein
MRKHLLLMLAATSSLCVLLTPQPSLGDEIPKIAWRRPLGQPLLEQSFLLNETAGRANR